MVPNCRPYTETRTAYGLLNETWQEDRKSCAVEQLTAYSGAWTGGVIQQDRGFLHCQRAPKKAIYGFRCAGISKAALFAPFCSTAVLSPFFSHTFKGLRVTAGYGNQHFPRKRVPIRRPTVTAGGILTQASNPLSFQRITPKEAHSPTLLRSMGQWGRSSISVT